MYLPTDGSEITLHTGHLLCGEYQPRDSGPGNLRLRKIHPESYESKEATFTLDPWSPEGFLVQEWSSGDAFVLCGAARILLVGAQLLTIEASIPLEYEECETLGHPCFIMNNDTMILSTESRVFCIDKRLAIRWCWTAAVHSNDWWRILRVSMIGDGDVRVDIRRIDREAAITLRLDDALQVER